MNAPVLAADDVRFSYRGDPVLEGVTFVVGPGEFAALAGPNGSGKSTLLRILLGLLRPRSGSVRLLGTAPDALRDRWRVGFVPQRSTVSADMPATAREVVATGRLARRGWWRRLGPADERAVDHALESVDLAALGDRRVAELSGGQQQRVLIARALASEPELLVLDEPVAGVDAESQKAFAASLSSLGERGGTVLLVSHELGAVADLLDRVIVLRRSVLFDGPPDELRARGVSLGVHDSDLPVWLEGV